MSENQTTSPAQVGDRIRITQYNPMGSGGGDSSAYDPEPAEANPEPQVTFTQQELDQAVREARTQVEQRTQLMLDKIMRYANEQADDRDWCDDYDEAVADIDSTIIPSSYYLERREQEVEIVWEQEVTVTVERRARMTVNRGWDADDVWGEFEYDEPSVYDVKEAVDAGHFTADDGEDRLLSVQKAD